MTTDSIPTPASPIVQPGKQVRTRVRKPKTWKKYEPFGTPPGSIRALLALAVVGGICGYMLLKPTVDVPQHVRDLMFIIIGHYFATRSAQPFAYELAEGEKVPNPLWLPKGTVRFLLIAMFVATSYVLYDRSQLWVNGSLSGASISLMLVGGFLLGVLLKQFLPTGPPNKKTENIKAVVAIFAAALLVTLMLDKLDLSTVPFLDGPKTKTNIEKGLAAVIGFYFGSRG